MPDYIKFPKEMGLPSNLVGELVRCAYGTRDAGAIWEDTYRGALEEMGFPSGIASPCCFHHPSRNLHLVVHGDDFTTMGVKADIDWFEKTLADHSVLKIRGRLGDNSTGLSKSKFLIELSRSPRMAWCTRRIRDMLISSQDRLAYEWPTLS